MSYREGTDSARKAMEKRSKVIQGDGFAQMHILKGHNPGLTATQEFMERLKTTAFNGDQREKEASGSTPIIRKLLGHLIRGTAGKAGGRGAVYQKSLDLGLPVIGATAGGFEEYNRAIDRGVTPGQAATSGLLGAAIGGTLTSPTYLRAGVAKAKASPTPLAAGSTAAAKGLGWKLGLPVGLGMLQDSGKTIENVREGTGGLSIAAENMANASEDIAKRSDKISENMEKATEYARNTAAAAQLTAVDAMNNKDKMKNDFKEVITHALNEINPGGQGILLRSPDVEAATAALTQKGIPIKLPEGAMDQAERIAGKASDIKLDFGIGAAAKAIGNTLKDNAATIGLGGLGVGALYGLIQIRRAKQQQTDDRRPQVDDQASMEQDSESDDDGGSDVKEKTAASKRFGSISSDVANGFLTGYTAARV